VTDRRGDEAVARVDFVSSASPDEPLRPLVMSQGSMVSSGHYLASHAGAEMFRRGGNAIDAGVAAGIALGILLFERVNFAGVAPIILHHAASRATVTIDGLGVFPESADVEFLRAQPDGLGPSGLYRAVTPAAPDAWLTALAEYGTLSACDVLEPNWELAHFGSPVTTGTAWFFEHLEEVSPWPVDLSFLPGGRVPRAGEIFARQELAKVIKSMMDAEVSARHRGLDRKEAIRCARDVFYKGWVAETIGAFFEEHDAWLRYEDLAQYSVNVEKPLHSTYQGYDVWTCGPWCQGPLLLQFLNVLENLDLSKMEHNSAEYLHVVAEAMNLGFADREAYYGDPRFVDVPMDRLLSKEYGAERARLISTDRAFGHMPPAGSASPEFLPPAPGVEASAEPSRTDTSYVAAVDEEGNVFSATPSDSTFWGPVIPSLGFSVSGRGINARLEPDHPSVAAPGKRPRLTPNPALAGAGGTPFMAIGCPGGDAQTQGMLQTLLNMIHFQLNPQQAIEAPRAISWNFPDSFAPHPYKAGRLHVEERIPATTREELRRLGHDVQTIIPWCPQASAVHVALVNPENGTLLGASDPRAEGQAVGWPTRGSNFPPA
jgi:gamma-glutamyltranspeptidase / glutathione hydrolase